MFWVIRCRVSGGVTGTREALLKDNGVVQRFPSERVAQEKCNELNRKMNNLYSTADFRYWPEEDFNVGGGAHWKP